MKKLRKLKIDNNSLNEKELSILKGGDTNNKNTNPGCVCKYYNGPSLSNTNDLDCSCVCVY